MSGKVNQQNNFNLLLVAVFSFKISLNNLTHLHTHICLHTLAPTHIHARRHLPSHTHFGMVYCIYTAKNVFRISEAEYTFRLHKDIIALRLQPRYYPDGWLGALVGNKLVFDFSNWDRYDMSFKSLVKELGDRGKGGRDEGNLKSRFTIAFMLLYFLLF